MKHALNIVCRAFHAVPDHGMHDAGRAQVAATPLTVQYLEDFFRNQSQQAAGAEERTRMEVFTKSALAMAVEDFQKVIKEYASKERILKAHPGEFDTAYGVARTRAKEARQIYGAARFGGVEVAPLGWGKAYEVARQVLKAKGIQWNGQPELSPEEKEVKRIQRAEVDVIRQAADKARKLIEGGEDRASINLDKLHEETREEQTTLKARKIAVSIVKAHGIEMAELVTMLLPDVIASGKAGTDEFAPE